MAIPTTEKIGDHTFVVGHIPAMKAPRALSQLLGIVGPIVGELLPLVTGATASKDIAAALSDGNLDGLIRKAVAIDPDAVMGLMLTLAEASSIIGQGGNLKTSFDLVFTGNLDLMIKWFVLAVRVNFGSFWKAAENAGR